MKRIIRMRSRVGSLFLALFVFTPLWVVVPQTSRAETIEDLKMTINQMRASMELLQQKVVALEEKQAAVPKDGSTTAPNGGSLLLPENTTVKLYGYAKFDGIYTDKDGGGETTYVPSKVPLDSASVADSALRMHAQQSRLGIFTSTPTDYGPMNIRIETDFFGSGGNESYSNSYGLRVRRAYGELGNLLAGQEWSTFIDLNSYPETIDFGGPAGSLFIRQAQIRWTQPFASGSLQFALENPESTFAPQDGSAPKDGSGEYLPDAVIRANLETSFGHFSIAGLGRQLIVDDDIDNDETYGGALSLTGAIPLLDKDKLVMMLNYGNALGRYMEAEFADAFIDPVTHKIETTAQWGGLVSYQHFWLDNLRSTLVYSYAERDNDLDFVADTVDSKYQSIHANLMWSPVSRVNLGLEYIYATREVENGDDGDINRLQLGFQYSF
jgi:hypothetical protein